MKIHKSQSGFSPLHILLLLVLLGIIGFAGWKVYDTNKSTKVTNSNPAVAVANKEEPKPAVPTLPAGFVEYQNKEVGFKFAYPKEWGDVSAKKTVNSGGKGYIYFGEFSANKEARVIYNSADYDAFPGGGCEVSRKVVVKAFDPKKIGANDKLVNAVNTDVLFKEAQYYKTDQTGDCVVDVYYDSATFNTKNTTYPAVELRYEYAQGRKAPAQEQFAAVLKTISLD